MKRISIIFTTLSSMLLLGVIVLFLVSIRPWQSKILVHGHSSEGHEYCIVQTYKDLIEPYQVSFYIRDTNGIWRWNYLEHEDKGWLSAEVTFTNGVAIIKRNGKLFKEIKIPKNQVDLEKILPGYRYEYCDSNYSVEDVFAFHNEKYN